MALQTAVRSSTPLSQGFQLFPKLAPEIRIKIWKATMPARIFKGALHKTDYAEASDDDGEVDLYYTSVFASQQQNPMALFINQESRAECLKMYKPFIVGSAITRYFSVEFDTLLIEGIDFWLDGEKILALKPCQPAILNTVQHLLVQDFWFESWVSEDLLRIINNIAAARTPKSIIMERTVLGYFLGLKTIELHAVGDFDDKEVDYGDCVQMVNQVAVPFMKHMAGLQGKKLEQKVVIEISYAEADSENEDDISLIE